MSRYITNPYLKDASIGSVGIDDEWLADGAKRVADMIMHRHLDKEEIRESGPYTGLSGIALALWKAAPVVGKEAREVAEKYWQHSLGNFDTNVKHARYLCGSLGSLITRMSKQDNLKEFAKKIEDLADILSKDDYPSDEILVGRAGYLSGVLWLRQTINASLISDEAVSKVLSAMINSGLRYSSKYHSPCPLFYEYHGTEYIGAAHGLAGIVQMALSFSHLLSAPAEKSVEETAIWLLNLQDEHGNYPSSTKRIGNEHDHHLIHWCHGAPGVIYLWLTLWIKYRNNKYLTPALRCGELIWEKGILKKGPGLCHGVSGNGYALLLLHRVTGDPLWLSRSLCFARLLLSPEVRSAQRIPDSPFSLFEGWAGALCFLVDLMTVNRSRAQFPLYPLPL